MEKLEQLRLLENGIPVHVVKTDYQSISVDRPEDIETVSRILQETGCKLPSTISDSFCLTNTYNTSPRSKLYSHRADALY
jgi:hypothetical protein